MSLIKWRKREITTAICSAFLVTVNLLLFHFIWKKYYVPFYYDPFYSIGRYAATVVCGGLYVYMGRLYGSFWLKISRISEILYANMVTNIMTGVSMYLVAWILIRHLPSIIPMLLIIGIWTVAACLWVKPAILVMNHYCTVERLAIIYDDKVNFQNAVAVLGRCAWRFKVAGEIRADGDISSTMKKLELFHAEAVLLCDVAPAAKKEILKQCVLHNIATYVQPDAQEYLINSARSVQVANLPFLFCQRAYDSFLYVFIKRGFDLVLGSAALLFLSPLMLVAAACVKLGDGGPVLRREQRITINKKEFTIRKFRTTRPGADGEEDSGIPPYADQRLTAVGKVLRRFRIDELPKLFNVIKGDIALVGPRMEKPAEAARHERELPEYALKFQVKAGLTGYVQIFGRYSTGTRDRLQMDLMYIGQRSLTWDLKMILATIKVIFLPEGMDLVLDNRIYTENVTEEERGHYGQTKA